MELLRGGKRVRDVTTEDGRGQAVEGVVGLVNDVVVVLERLHDDDGTENFWKRAEKVRTTRASL